MPPDVLFTPRLTTDPTLEKLEGSSGQKSIGAMVHSWIADFFAVCKLVKRLDRTEGDFLNEVHEREEIKYRVHEVVRHLNDSFDIAEQLLLPFRAHEHLWKADINAELASFLANNPGKRAGAVSTEPTTPGEPSAADVAAGVMSRHQSEAAQI